MSGALAVARREIQSLFASPLAYVLASAFVSAQAFYFNIYVRAYARRGALMAQRPGGLEQLDLHDWVMAPVLSNTLFLMLILVPFLTMRSIAEERRQETAELLFTSPITSLQIVLGKYLGNLWMVAVMLLLSLSFPLYLMGKTGVDWGPIFTGYLGVLLLSSAFISVGIFFSSLTEHQILAGVVSFLSLMAFYVLGLAARLFGAEWQPFLESATFASHFEDFARGIIDTGDIVYFVSFTIFFLFLTHRWLDSERWRS